MTEHTPGPWSWNLNLKSKQVRLESNGLPGSMHEIVMDFVRWGFGGAAPRFRQAIPSRPSLVLMHRAEEFGEVVPGRSHHSDWYQVLGHPDARLIAAAPDMLRMLRAVVAAQEEMNDQMRDRRLDEVDLEIRGLIARIEGRAGREE